MVFDLWPLLFSPLDLHKLFVDEVMTHDERMEYVEEFIQEVNKAQAPDQFRDPPTPPQYCDLWTWTTSNLLDWHSQSIVG